MNGEILGIFPAAFEGWDCKLVFTTNRLIVAKYKRSLGERLFGGSVYGFHQVSTRDRLKMKKVSAETFLKADPENFEISYPNITVVEHEIIGATILLKIFMDDLDVPKYRFTLYIKESHKGEIKEFLNEVLPGKV